MRIAVTTYSRSVPTLNRTLISLKGTGFDKVTVFEGDGAWPNWFNSLWTLTKEYPSEKYYGIIQDDVVFCKGIKNYLESIDLPQVFSVFCPSLYKQEGSAGRWSKQNRGGHMWMAQTLFFSRAASLSLLNSRLVWQVKGDRQIDNRVGIWAESVGLPVCYHSPSLAQHIGETSTLWKVGVDGDRKADDFVGEDYIVQ